MASGIYKIEHVATGKCYIGSAVNLEKRWREHRFALRRGRHFNVKLQRAWDKHEEASFVFSVLESVVDQFQLIMKEQEWIDRLNACSDAGYNLSPTAGSPLGVKRSAETRAAWSRSRRGQKRAPLSEETKLKIGKANKGRPRSAETIEKRANTMRGRIMPEEWRMNISKALRGRKVSDEHAQKISEAKRGKGFSDEHRAKLSAARRAFLARTTAEPGQSGAGIRSVAALLTGGFNG